MKNQYRYVATNPHGMVRHIATNWIRHGYRFYICGSVKPTRDPEAFDRIMQEKFHYQMSRSWRNRRKNACGPNGEPLGLANIHYMRHERFWILIATKGYHAFYEAHSKRDKWGRVLESYFRDVHRDPILFHGYSIRYAEGGYLARSKWEDPECPEQDLKRRVRVRIAEEEYRTLKADMIARAKSGSWSAEALEAAIWNLPYLPFRPVREQLWNLVRWMNQARKERGFQDRLNPTRCIRRRIPPVSAFEPVSENWPKAA